MKAEKQTETLGATPEQLLQILDAQLASQRSHRAASNRNRATILVAGLLFIVAATGAALFVLDRMLADLRSNGAVSQSAPTEVRENF